MSIHLGNGPSARIWIFLNPQRFLSGYAFHPHASGEFAGQSGIFGIRSPEGAYLNPLWIRNRVDANPEFFFYPDDVTRSSPVPYCEINSQDGCRGQYYFFTSWTYFKLNHVCAVKHSYEHCTLQLCFIILWGVPSTRVHPDTFRIRVDGQIRFEYAACGWEYFFSGNHTHITQSYSCFKCQRERPYQSWVHHPKVRLTQIVLVPVRSEVSIFKPSFAGN